jgi:glucose-6-phosphate 1-dehydrogenase
MDLPTAQQPSDALVLFGASGDLAAKMIFPALARLAARERLALPVIALGRQPIDHDAFVRRIRAQVVEDDPTLGAPFDRLAPRLRYLAGDLREASTFAAIRTVLGDAAAPLHYLAIPPVLFAPVIEALGRSGLARGARVAIEKPFGHDLDSARALERVVAATFTEADVLRIDHFLAKDPLRNLAAMRARSAWLEPLWSHQNVRSVQVTMAEAFGIAHRGAFYEGTGALRDVFQNHLLELCALVAMEPAAPADGDAYATARIAALRAIAPLGPDDVVYGQYEGYRSEPEVAADSRVPTYLAVRLSVDTPRFAGVPFYVRAGKRLPLTTTLLSLDLNRVRPLHQPSDEATRECLRFRLGPGAVAIALDTHRLLPGTPGAPAPLTLAGNLPRDEDRDAYVNILHAVLHGDHSVSERASGVTAAWNVVDGVLRADLPVHPYPAGSWGPPQADRLLSPGERWIDPVSLP